MKSQATTLRILETIDMINYTFKQKSKGAGISPDKKFLVKLRTSLTGKDTAFLSTDCMNVFYELYNVKPLFSKIHDLRFPTAFFSLKALSIPSVLCEIVVAYLGPDEDTCHICQCKIGRVKEEKHYMTKRHQINLLKTELIPDILSKAYKNTFRELPRKSEKVILEKI
jgi:hypothetical protein